MNLVTSYQDDGFISPLQAFSQPVAQEYLSCLQDTLEKFPRPPIILEQTQFHLTFSWAFNLVCEENVLNVIKSLLGSEIYVWASSVFSKNPESKSFVDWHQDAIKFFT